MDDDELLAQDYQLYQTNYQETLSPAKNLECVDQYDLQICLLE
jgi:hypothetical protein